MDLREKLIYALAIALTISSILMGHALYQINETLESGEHLKNARVNFSLHPSMPWADIPIFLREQIAMGHPGTKIDMTDLLLIQIFYQRLIDTYDNRALSIAENFDKDGRLVEEKKEGAE